MNIEIYIFIHPCDYPKKYLGKQGKDLGRREEGGILHILIIEYHQLGSTDTEYLVMLFMFLNPSKLDPT